jgi:hypothetical protein
VRRRPGGPLKLVTSSATPILLSASTKGGTLDLRDLEKAAKRQGWGIDRTKAGHVRFWPPDSSIPPSVFSGTPSDWRAIRNFLADLRRKGLAWPPEGKGRKRKG